jgi:LysR family nitrogen assimilation transcriptional regulator
MHVAQPALGAQLRELEDEMGVPLLSRHSRGVEPTQAGTVLYQHARRILDQVDQVKAEVVRAHLTARRPVSLGLPTSLTLLIGTDLQIAAAERTQRIALSIVEGPSFFLADAIERQELDLAFVYDVEPRPGLTLRVILDEELLFVSAPSASSGDAVTLPDVLQSRLALGGRRDVARRALARAAGVLPEAIVLAYETQSIAAILDLIERGEACSVMPYGSVAREVAAGRLRVHRIAGTPLRTTMYLARRAHLDHGEAEALLSDTRLLVDQGIDMIVNRAAPHVERH